ncbi:MAG: 2Fe-2S iron-sulfur cluster binding domain-containing protein, partial [Chloroflexi bacterium]|nr:2Fe-2S iron-sulfur cluster binding domain-containing protein [Chloroflexota bacterium]
MTKILFRPQGKTVEVPDGTLLSEAILQTGISVNLPCGGQGRCGRCRVVIEQGVAQQRSTSRLSSSELEQGYVLACQTAVFGDLQVFLPPQEAIVRKLPSERAAVEIPALSVRCDWQKNPILRKFFLRIEPPSLSDNTTDFERLRRALTRQCGVRGLVAGLPVLRKLARTLRDSASPEEYWEVTAVVEMGTWVDEDSVPRLVDLLPGDQTVQILVVAVDVGTTSNVVYLADLASG